MAETIGGIFLWRKRFEDTSGQLCRKIGVPLLSWSDANIETARDHSACLEPGYFSRPQSNSDDALRYRAWQIGHIHSRGAATALEAIHLWELDSTGALRRGDLVGTHLACDVWAV